MDKIKIITDSTADLPKDLYDKNHIEVLPLLVNFGQESYLDGVEITTKDVFEKMGNNNIVPTTSQVNPSRFIEVYKKYLNEGYKIISIHMSSVMSGTYQSACIAKETLESDDIIVIDSQSVTCALGLLVLKAVILKENGYTIFEIEKQLNEVKNKVKVSICFESLEYLVRGGRISKTAGLLGNVFGIKLILEIKDGIMAVKDKIRGSKKATKKIIQDLENYQLDSEVPVVIIDVGNAEMEIMLKEYLQQKDIKFIECCVGPTVAIHSGPNCCGYIYLTK